MDTCKRPEAGWTSPDERGFVRFTMHGRVFESAPTRDGYEAFFVAVHGVNFTTWTYRPVEPEHVCGTRPDLFTGECPACDRKADRA